MSLQAYFIILLFFKTSLSIAWNIDNYPNPLSDYQACSMNYSSQICDPDNVLLNSENRIRINDKLLWLKEATSKNDSNGCKAKGLTTIVLIGKQFEGGAESFLNNALAVWDLDSECRKAIVIMLASEDRDIWINGDEKVEIKCEKYQEIYDDQKNLLHQGDYTQALLNIIEAIKAANGASGGLPDWAIIAIIFGAMLLMICVSLIGVAIYVFCCPDRCDSSSSYSGGHTYGGGGGGAGACSGGGGACSGGGGGF